MSRKLMRKIEVEVGIQIICTSTPRDREARDAFHVI